MDYAKPVTRLVAAVSAALLSAALLFAGTGLHPVWWLTWLAPLPLLWLPGRLRNRRDWLLAGAAAFVAWFAGGASMWHYLRDRMQLPGAIVLLALAVPALLSAIGILLWRAFLLRKRAWLAAFSLPCYAVTAEYLTAALSPHSTFGNVAYSQMDFLPVIQVAAVTGIWGISFLLWLVPSTIGVLMSEGVASRVKRRLGVCVGAIAAIGWIAGGMRLWLAPVPSGSITAQLITSDAPRDIVAAGPEEALALVGRYAGAVPGFGARAADVILMPEKIAPLPAAGAGAAKAMLASAASRAKAELVVGLDEVAPDGRKNEALLFSRDRNIEVNYEKQHFIPVLETGYVVGHDYPAFQRPSGRWGIAICKDLDFPALGREFGRLGVGLLLVPA